MPTKLDTSVVVVGGSLVGLSTALFLSHWNVPVVLIERHPTSSAHPRAIGYTSRTIEFLRSVGAESDLPNSSIFSGPPRRISVQSLAGKWSEEQAWTKPPGGGPGGKDPGAGRGKGPGGPPPFTDYSPSAGLACAQDVVEPALRQRATELGADLRLGFKVTSWQQDDNGVTVMAVSKGGEEINVAAKYLVACDGGKSPIREQLGLQRHGVGHLRGLRSILFRCSEINEYFQKGYQQFQIEGRDDGFEAFMTTYGDGRLALMWNETGDPHMDDATQKSWIRKATGKDIPDEDISLITTGQWDIGGFITDQFSSGRVFLAGDAAHTLPPNRGGYGANTGIADAHNIAWKLAAVLAGTSRPELLDTYDAERRPASQVRHDQIFLRDDHARFVKDRDWKPKSSEILDEAAVEFGQLYRSDGIIGSTEGLPDAQRPQEWKGQPGTRAPHMKLRKGDEEISTLDLFGKTWVVVAEDASWGDVVRKGAEETGVECSFVQIGGGVAELEEGKFEATFGVTQTGAVLIRPDGVIAWRIESNPEDATSAFTKALGQASFSVKGTAA